MRDELEAAIDAMMRAFELCGVQYYMLRYWDKDGQSNLRIGAPGRETPDLMVEGDGTMTITGSIGKAAEKDERPPWEDA